MFKNMVLLTILVSMGLGASLEPSDNTNSNAKNNKIVDNPETITNEYLQFMFDDKKLTNEYLILKKAEEQKESNASVAAETNSSSSAQNLEKIIIKIKNKG